MNPFRCAFIAFSMLACAPRTHPVSATDPGIVPAKSTPILSTRAEDAAPSSVHTDGAGPLMLTGTPAIPDALRDRLNQYLNTRRASLADISPDASKVLIRTRFGETDQLHVVERPMGTRRQLTFLSEPVGGASWVPGGSGDILYAADSGGNEQHQLFRVSASTGRPVRLTDPAARNQNPVWSRDGKQLAFMSNQRNKKDFDIVLSDGRDPKSARVLVEGKGYWYPMDFSPDGKRILIGEYVSINLSHLYIADIATGKVSRLSPESPAASYKAAKFGGGGVVYVSTDRDGEFSELYELNVATATWKPLTRNINWDVQGLTVSKDLKTVAFVVNVNGSSAVYLMDAKRRKPKKLSGLPKGIIGGVRFAERAPVLALSVNSATSPGDVYTYHLTRRKLTRWTQSEVGGLDSAAFTAPMDIQFPTFDGRTIPAFYYRPNGRGPFPVIINIHGGPEAQARPSFSSFTQMLVNELGIAVIYPNVRGSNGYGKSYLRLDNGFLREDSVKDVGSLLDWIASRPELDGSRIGVMGGSYGGYMVLASLVHFGDRIAAGVDTVGISNFVTFLENTADYRRDVRRAEYGDERDNKMRHFLQTISPTNNASKIRSALFVAQGANDPRVPASEAEQVVKEVRSNGHEVWYMLARNEGHGFKKKSNRDTFLLLTALFFQQHLAGPSPAQPAAGACVDACVQSRQMEARGMDAIEQSCASSCTRKPPPR